MSLEVTKRIWKHTEAEGSELVVLLAIGDYANADGEAWPSLELLARRARVSERQVRRLLGRLAERGDLRVAPGCGRGQRSRYVVTCGAEEKGTTSTEKGVIADRAYKEVEPLENHQKGEVRRVKGEREWVSGGGGEGVREFSPRRHGGHGEDGGGLTRRRGGAEMRRGRNAGGAAVGRGSGLEKYS